MNPAADFFFNKTGPWQEVYGLLRSLALDSKLTEELKWGCPCYTHEGKNMVLIHGFKNYCALLFLKGALMKDPENILIQQTPQVQAARQIRFTGSAQIRTMRTTLKAYLREAIELEKAGAKVGLKPVNQYTMPEEFQRALLENAELQTGYDRLTPGRKRAYLLFFSSAKQAKTREARIEKYYEKIVAGKGMDD
jgi:uncharacterized protein YdeI (YjbR/CyaY-like superfamily)